MSVNTTMAATSQPLLGNLTNVEYDTSLADNLDLNFFCGNLTSNVSELNCTVTELTSSEEEKNYWALMLLFLPIFTVFGNLLVILAVFRERSLKSATNYFIVSLAVADCLVATTAMPFAVYVLVNGAWSLPTIVCDFYIAMDVICSSSSIFNLVAISIDRYIAITRPISYARHRDNRRVYLTIVLVWIISIAIGLPITLGLNETSERVHSACIFYNSDFILYSSLSSFYIPCIIMVFLYYRIFKALRIRARHATKKRNGMDSAQPTIIENVTRNKSPQLPSSESHTVANGNSRNGEDEQSQDDEYDPGAEEDGSDEAQENAPLEVSKECFAPAASVIAITTRELQQTGTDLDDSPNKTLGNAGSLGNAKTETANHKNNLWSYLTKTSSERDGETNSYLPPPPYEKSIVQNGPRFTICRARKASRKKREKPLRNESEKRQKHWRLF